jgi:formate dehydrogenase subunit gamma
MHSYETWDPVRAAEILAPFGNRRDAMLPMLHAIQDCFGYVPEPVVPMIAETVNISRAEAHGVVTFYHDFRHEMPGRHVLKLCRAEACQSMGGDALAAHAEAKLGQALGTTSADGALSFEPIYCLGLCSTAPSAMLDGKLHGRLTPERFDALVEKALS